jgi:hypothetical protein
VHTCLVFVCCHKVTVSSNPFKIFGEQ